MNNIMLLMLLILTGCCQGPICELRKERSGEGGGRDAIPIDLPFAEDYVTKCVQGTGGAYSHTYTSTLYDLDFDTPNTEDIPVFAPANGTLFVHDDDAKTNFGIHANIDLGDGTYIVLGHMKEVFVDSESEVVSGQLLGYEGTTGNSSGDHVHIGRHVGDAEKDAKYGTSLDGLMIRAQDRTAETAETETLVENVTCGLSSGHDYVSGLKTVKWHPDGTLVKTPDRSTVYVILDNARAAFTTEEAFLSRGYDFSEVTLVTEEELGCYSYMTDITSPSRVRALKDSAGKAWLLLGEPSDMTRERWEVKEIGAVGVLQSYGIITNSFNDIDYGKDEEISLYPNVGTAGYRDGTLISPLEASDVYVMTHGIAMPIDSWSTFLLMGWGERQIIEVPMSEIDSVVRAKGNCVTDTYCITKENSTTCGGPMKEVPGEEDEVDSDEEGGGEDEDGDSGVALSAFVVAFQVPGGVPAAELSFSGEYRSASGGTTGWVSDLQMAVNTTTIEYEVLGAGPGDSFRFSVEYTVNGVKNWSCLAPFPPGEVTGEVTATLDGSPLSVVPVADPVSSGCGLMVTVP